jgi:hypothetical protein
VAEPVLEGGVHELELAFLVEIGDQHRQIIGQQLEALLAGGLAQLGALALRDVERHQVVAGDAAVGRDLRDHVAHDLARRTLVMALAFVVHVLAAQRRLVVFRQAVVELLAEDFFDGLAQHGLRIHAHHGAEMLVAEAIAQVAVQVGDQRRQAVGDSAQALFAGGDQCLAVADGLLRRLAFADQFMKGAAQLADLVAAAALQHPDVGDAVADVADVAAQPAEGPEQHLDRDPRQQPGHGGEGGRGQHGVAAHDDHRRERFVHREAGTDDPVGAFQPLVRVDALAAIFVGRFGPAFKTLQRHFGGAVVAGAGVDVFQQARGIRMMDQCAARGHDEGEAGLARLLRRDLFQERRVGQVDATAQQHGGTAAGVQHRMQDHDGRQSGQQAFERRRHHRLAGGQHAFEIGADARVQLQRGGLVARRVDQHPLAIKNMHVEELPAHRRMAVDEDFHAGGIEAGVGRHAVGQAGQQHFFGGHLGVHLRGGGGQQRVLLIADDAFHIALGQHQRHPGDDDGRDQHQHDHHAGHAESEAAGQQ